jgi:hypothetical protein
MSYSASALSFMLENLAKPVIFNYSNYRYLLHKEFNYRYSNFFARNGPVT